MISLANGALVARPLIVREFLGLNVSHSQSVRWRKPLWLGTAKTKVFRVPIRPVIPKEEAAEIMRLSNNYKTYRASLRRYFMKVAAQNMIQFDEESVRRQEDEDFARCSCLNEEWNRRVAESREKREFDELEARKAVVLQKIIEKEERDRELMEKIDSNVRKAKAEAPTFITAKNIDEAIEKALADVVNYNAAIDTEGKTYEGKYEPAEKERPRRFHAEQ